MPGSDPQPTAAALATPGHLPDTENMLEPISLANHFLIAMPALADPNFQRTVTLICQHTNEGALGIVINRTTDLTMRDVLQQMNIPMDRTKKPDMPVYYGGPVQNERGFILHRALGSWGATLPVSETLGLTTSRDILEAIAEDRGPADCLIALGYAGWGSGQLEREMAENAWLNGPADYDIIFNAAPETRWMKAAALLGVDLGTLSGEAGHA